MRPAVFAALIFHVVFVATAATVEDGTGTVFDMSALVDEADGFAEGVAKTTAAQSELTRVQAMKAALTKKLMRQELSKLPYSEKELGEGMAVTAVKDKISENYGSFKEMAKAIEGQKTEVEKKLAVAENKATDAEKKELKSRKDAAELRQKLRDAKEKETPEGQDDLVSKLSEDVTNLKDQLETTKRVESETKKRTTSELKKMRKFYDKGLENKRQQIINMRDEDEAHIANFKQNLKSSWYFNSSKTKEFKKKFDHSQNQVSTLEVKIKDIEQSHKEAVVALKQEFLQRERDQMEEYERNIGKQKKKVAGEKQKEEWDKEAAVSAEAKAREDNKAMSEAVKANEALTEKETDTEAKLGALEKKEETEKEAAGKQIDDLKLTTALEKVNEDQASLKVNSSQAVASQHASRADAQAQTKIKEAEDKAKKSIADMRRKLEEMQDKYTSAEQLQKANEQKRITEEQGSADKEVDQVQEKEKLAESSEQLATTKASEEKEKLGIMQEELEQAKAKMKEMEDAQSKEEDMFKKQAKEDADRIAKRAGSRTEAQAEKQLVENADSTLAVKTAALQKASKRVEELAKHNDALQKKVDTYRTGKEQAEYKHSVEKKKRQDLEMELQATKLKADMQKKTSEHDRELGEASQMKDEGMEKRYKYEVKAASALKEQVAVEQRTNALHISNGQKWEAKAQKYKQAMYAAEAHARRTAARVRKSWAAKMIKEQDAHTKELLKLKHFIGTRQTKHDAEMMKVKSQEATAERKADKAEAGQANGEQVFRYVAGMVGEQSIKAKVLRDYMFQMGKIRKKYNKNLNKEYKDEVKRLKKRVRSLENGHDIAKLKMKIIELQHGGEQQKAKRTIKMEVKRAQELDVQTLLNAAISRASKGSRNRSGRSNRHRVDAAVEAVIKTVKAADTKQGEALADKALSNLDEHSSNSPAEMKAKMISLERENTRLRRELKTGAPRGRRGRRERRSRGGSDAEENHDEDDDEDSSSVARRGKPDINNARTLSPKQKRLLGKLNRLVQMSGMSSKTNTITTEAEPALGETAPTSEWPKPPFAKGEEGVQETPESHELAEVGELKRGAFSIGEVRELRS